MAKKFDIPQDEYSLDRKFTPQFSSENLSISVADIPVDKIICDDENGEMSGEFNQDDINSLAQDIQENGFKGVILAYPIDDGLRYQIESGHKRFLAAKQAGLQTLSVNITTPPKSEAERRIRLANMNLHGRETLKPSDQSRVIVNYFENYRTLCEEHGKSINTEELTSILASKFRLSEQSVYKYRQFAKLNKSLQQIADEGISWSALITCSSFPHDSQEMIALSIRTEIERVGAENVSRPWVLRVIQNMRQQVIEEGEKIAAPRTNLKRRDGAKLIAKCAHDIEGIISSNVFIKDSNKEESVKYLKNMKEIINKKLSELEEQ